MMSRMLIAFGFVIATAGSASAIELPDKFPIAGQPTTIKLSAPADEITFTYQPAAPIARAVTLKTDGKLEVPWTPEQAGIVSISAGDDSKDVSVRFSGTPWLGVLIFLFAGCVLFGGATICLRALFAGPPDE